MRTHGGTSPGSIRNEGIMRHDRDDCNRAPVRCSLAVLELAYCHGMRRRAPPDAYGTSGDQPNGT